MQYTDIIFTNHALEKITNRGISKNYAYETLVHPDVTRDGKKHGTIEYQKRFDNLKITAIAKKNEKGEWIVISIWRDPPMAGTEDAIRRGEWKKSKRPGALGLIWKTIKQQLGIR